MSLNLWHLQRDPDDVLHNRDIVHLVRALRLRDLHSFLSAQAPVVVQQRVSLTLSKNCSCGISLHCGYTSLEHTGKVHHSVDELNLGHLHVLVHYGLLELVADDHRDVHNQEIHPPPPPQPT